MPPRTPVGAEDKGLEQVKDILDGEVALAVAKCANEERSRRQKHEGNGKDNEGNYAKPYADAPV
jgi:hypothetical protein